VRTTSTLLGRISPSSAPVAPHCARPLPTYIASDRLIRVRRPRHWPVLFESATTSCCERTRARRISPPVEKQISLVRSGNPERASSMRGRETRAVRPIARMGACAPPACARAAVSGQYQCCTHGVVGCTHAHGLLASRLRHASPSPPALQRSARHGCSRRAFPGLLRH
jgi:hypothetical protein